MRPPQPPTGAGLDFSRLHDLDYRKSIMQGHAMRSEFYRAQTPITDEVYDAVYSDVIRGSGGCMFSGTQRIGKTHCSYVVFDRLAQDIPGIALEYVVAKDEMGRKYSDFCMHMLEAFGHATEVRRKFTNWERLIIDHVRTACLNSECKIFFMVVDEAQRLRIEQYRHLFNLSNALATAGHRLATILFAQKRSMSHLMMQGFERDQIEISGRFFVRPLVFRGIRTEKELESLLDQYDAHLFYPINAQGWCYTRFYACDRFDEGWRLSHEASAFWTALEGAAGVIGELSEDSVGFGMNWIVRAIHYYLTDELMSGEATYDDEERWKTAIKETANLALMAA